MLCLLAATAAAEYVEDTQPPDGPVVLCECHPSSTRQKWGLGIPSGKATAVFSYHGEISYCLTFDDNRTLTLESCVNSPQNDLFTFGGRHLPNIEYLGAWRHSTKTTGNNLLPDPESKSCLAWANKGEVGEKVTFAPEDDADDQFFLYDARSSSLPQHIVAVQGRGAKGLCLTTGGRCPLPHV